MTKEEKDPLIKLADELRDRANEEHLQGMAWGDLMLVLMSVSMYCGSKDGVDGAMFLRTAKRLMSRSRVGRFS